MLGTKQRYRSVCRFTLLKTRLFSSVLFDLQGLTVQPKGLVKDRRAFAAEPHTCVQQLMCRMQMERRSGSLIWRQFKSGARLASFRKSRVVLHGCAYALTLHKIAHKVKVVRGDPPVYVEQG